MAATYVLAHDRGFWIVPRFLACALSANERAFLRLFVMGLLDDVLVPDARFVWLARRITFALARRSRDCDGAMLDAEIDLSGWGGQHPGRGGLERVDWGGVMAVAPLVGGLMEARGTRR